tara:strand:+ start:7929 stop:8906 length:978 start_codon:yes stop_codon:yes gene_type:complete
MIQIIGGSGFVGTEFIKLIGPEKCQNLDKLKSDFYNDITKIGNITKKKDIVLSAEANVILLLAAEHKDDILPTSLYYSVNVEGTKNILDKMDQMGIKNLIFTSSVAVYGLNKNNPDEKHAIDPFNHYGKSKWEAEKLIKAWYDSDPEGKSITIIRPTVIFGERNRGNVYNLLRQISSGRFLMIGKGQNKKSMAYVGNIVAFIKDRIERQETGYHVYNYADKPDFTMSELSSIIQKKMRISLPKTRVPYWLGILGGYGFDLLALLIGKKFSISSVRVKKFCATTEFDATKAHLIFSAPYSLEEGLNKTLEFEFINPKEDDILFYSE